MATSGNEFEEVTVRVMYYKEGEEAVYYIYAKTNGTPSEIEVLCAVGLNVEEAEKEFREITKNYRKLTIMNPSFYEGYAYRLLAHKALKEYDACDKKIRERGHSIVGAANKLIQLGVPRNTKKLLPPEIGMEEVE